mmetsp:Transcript_9308/g.22860  ORF Transcript_9308/g.22860 Transcript_9308/m.22860 type:complete len:460 (-) Transcript_9308:29-1408(-)
MTGAYQHDDISVTEIEDNLKSRNSLALYRIRLLNRDENLGDGDRRRSEGFPSLFLGLLGQSVNDFIALVSIPQKHDDGEQNDFLSKIAVTRTLTRILKIYRKISEFDPVLCEEIGKEGAHHFLSRIIKIDIFSIDFCQGTDDIVNEANQDTIIEIQDLAGEIAASANSFPLQASPYVHEELLERLPMTFKINPTARFNEYETGYDEDGITILINQVTDRQSAQKDVGFVMWPSAVVLSRWLVSNPTALHGKTVLELGAGCGLTGLVAAKIIQNNKKQDDNTLNASDTRTSTSTELSNSSSVILTDFNEIVVRNLRGNIALNNLDDVASAENLDFYQQNPDGKGWFTMDGIEHTERADIILAADVICQPEDAFALARSIASALRENCKAIVVSADSKHRFGVEKFEEACKAVKCLSILRRINIGSSDFNVNSIDEDMEKTSGFVDGMTLTMYTIIKNSKI